MDRLQQKTAQMGVKALAFAAIHAVEFNHTPPTPADTNHAATIAKLQGAINALGGAAAIQEGRNYEEASDSKNITLHDLEGLVRRVNKTAGSIARADGMPQIMESFRMPHGHGVEEWKTKARAMAKSITDLGLESQFDAHNFTGAADALTAAAGGVVSGQGDQGIALSNQVKASRQIDAQIETLKSAVQTFDALYENTYVGQPDVIGAWKSASHVEKVSSKKPKKPGTDDKAAGNSGPAPAK